MRAFSRSSAFGAVMLAALPAAAQNAVSYEYNSETARALAQFDTPLQKPDVLNYACTPRPDSLGPGSIVVQSVLYLTYSEHNGVAFVLPTTDYFRSKGEVVGVLKADRYYPFGEPKSNFLPSYLKKLAATAQLDEDSYAKTCLQQIKRAVANIWEWRAVGKRLVGKFTSQVPNAPADVLQRVEPRYFIALH